MTGAMAFIRKVRTVVFLRLWVVTVEVSSSSESVDGVVVASGGIAPAGLCCVCGDDGGVVALCLSSSLR